MRNLGRAVSMVLFVALCVVSSATLASARGCLKCINGCEGGHTEGSATCSIVILNGQWDCKQSGDCAIASGGGEHDGDAAGLPKSEGTLPAVDPLTVGTRFVSLLSGALYGVEAKRTGEDEQGQLALAARARIGAGGGGLVDLATFNVFQITGLATELVVDGTRLSVRPEIVDEEGVSFRIGKSMGKTATDTPRRAGWGSTATIDVVIAGKAYVLVLAPTKYSDDEQGYQERSVASDKVVAGVRSSGKPLPAPISDVELNSYGAIHGAVRTSWGQIKTIYR